jgi:hypothetical protein
VPDAVAEFEGSRGELRSPPRSQTVTYVDVALIGEQFGVSYPAAVWRLLGLVLINSATAETLMKQTTAANRYLKEVKSMVGDDAPPMTDADLRWQIFPLAIEAWRRELITEGRLREVATHLNFEDPEVAVELAELLV